MGKSIKFSLSILAIIFFSLFFHTPVTAEQLYVVGTDNLNIRSSPAHTAPVVGQLAKGDQLVAFGEKFGWIQTYYKGKEAWVASQYLITNNHKTNIQTNQAAEKITVTAQSVRLRTGPGLNYTISGYANYGDQFELMSRSGDWLNIANHRGQSMWVASWLTDQSAQTKTVSTAENPIPTSQPKPTAKNHQQRNSNLPLAGLNIVLDAGHGGIDPGSVSLTGKFEKEYTLTTTLAVAEELRRHGANVVLTRSGDTTVSLDRRVQISHAYSTDAFISLHYDAFTSNNIHGVSTHFYGSRGSLNLAQTIQNELHKQTGLNNRGIMNSPYYVLRNNKQLAILVELGFLTSNNDLVKIEQNNHSNQVATAITRALINYFQ